MKDWSFTPDNLKQLYLKQAGTNLRASMGFEPVTRDVNSVGMLYELSYTVTSFESS